MKKTISIFSLFILSSSLISCANSITPVYHVYFLEENGEIYKDLTVYKGDKVNKPEDPSKNYFDFAGWYLDKEYTSPYNFDLEVNNDITLYPQFTAHHYSITYRNDDELVYTPINEYIYGVGVSSFGDVTDLKPGDKFYGWYLDEEYENPISSISETMHGDLVLYAKRSLMYSITYVNWPRDLENKNPTSYTCYDEFDFNLSVFSFYKGFSNIKLLDGENEVTGIGYGSTGNKTITLEYDLTKTTVTLNPAGGKLIPHNPYIYIKYNDDEDAVKINITDRLGITNIYDPELFPIPYIEGKVFDGYYYDENYTKPLKEDATNSVIVGSTIYAKWIDTDARYSIPLQDDYVEYLLEGQNIEDVYNISIPKNISKAHFSLIIPGIDGDVERSEQDFVVNSYSDPSTYKKLIEGSSSGTGTHIEQDFETTDTLFYEVRYNAFAMGHDGEALYYFSIMPSEYKTLNIKLEGTTENIIEEYEYWSVTHIDVTREGYTYIGWFHNSDNVVTNYHWMQTEEELEISARWWKTTE